MTAAPPLMLTSHFALSEFAVSASFPELVRPVPDLYVPDVRRLAALLERIRARVGVPIRILSCYRPPALNREIGGSPTSQHLLAQAVDFRPAGDAGTPSRLYSEAHQIVQEGWDVGQVIVYPAERFIHMALPNTRFRHPALFVHHPARRVKYRRVASYDEGLRLLV